MIGAVIDAWRRIMPGSPRIKSTRFYDRQSKVPPRLPRHQLALVGGTEERAKWAVFECPCGTGHRIMLPLSHTARPRWTVQRDDRGRIDLSPSVDHVGSVRCHFWLRAGRIRWAPSRSEGRLGPPSG